MNGFQGLRAYLNAVLNAKVGIGTKKETPTKVKSEEIKMENENVAPTPAPTAPAEQWEDIKGTSGMWLPEEVGDMIEGTIESVEDGLYGLQATIVSGEDTYRTPSHKVLQNRLSECSVGDYVRITFEKEELPTVKGRNGTKIYRVQVRK